MAQQIARCLIILEFLLNFTSPSFADTTAQCSLPVCNIPQEIEVLRASSENDRYLYVSGLNKTYKNATDPAVLANLRDFAQAAHQLFVSLQEEDWLIREADNLSALSLTGLAKYSRPISSAEMLGDYRALTAEEQRFDVLLYWTNQVKTLQSVHDISEVITFAQSAGDLSRGLKDDDYVSRQAQTVVELGTAQFNAINPYYEGVYSIRIECAEDPCSDDLSRDFGYLVVLDTMGDSSGLTVSLVGGVSITLQHAAFDAATSTLKGLENNDAFPARSIQVRIDPVTRELTGYYEDTRNPGRYALTGTPVVSLGDELAGERETSSLTIDRVTGAYPGHLGQLSGTLFVKSLGSGVYSGSFQSSAEIAGSHVYVDYQVVRWMNNPGLLLLAGRTANGNFTKLVLDLASGRGFSFGTQGRVWTSVEFKAPFPLQ